MPCYCWSSAGVAPTATTLADCRAESMGASLRSDSTRIQFGFHGRCQSTGACGRGATMASRSRKWGKPWKLEQIPTASVEMTSFLSSCSSFRDGMGTPPVWWLQQVEPNITSTSNVVGKVVGKEVLTLTLDLSCFSVQCVNARCVKFQELGMVTFNAVAWALPEAAHIPTCTHTPWIFKSTDVHLKKTYCPSLYICLREKS